MNTSQKNLLFLRGGLSGRPILDTVKEYVASGYRSGSITAWESAVVPDGPPGFQWGIIEYRKHSTAYVTVIAMPDGGPIYYRQIYANDTNGWRWNTDDWYTAATATPPQKYDLPLAEGVTINTASRYCKSQDNMVHVYGSVKLGTAPTGGLTLATLPAGYLPSDPVVFTISSSSSSVGESWSTYGFVQKYGAITLVNTQLPSNFRAGGILAFNFSFVAAT